MECLCVCDLAVSPYMAWVHPDLWVYPVLQGRQVEDVGPCLARLLRAFTSSSFDLRSETAEGLVLQGLMECVLRGLR